MQTVSTVTIRVAWTILIMNCVNQFLISDSVDQKENISCLSLSSQQLVGSYPILIGIPVWYLLHYWMFMAVVADSYL